MESTNKSPVQGLGETVTQEDADKQSKIHDYIASKGGDTSKLTKLITDEALLATINDHYANFRKVEWSIKKRYANDHKRFVKKYEELRKWLSEHAYSNHHIHDALVLLAAEIREHPAAKQADEATEQRLILLKVFAKTHTICVHGGKVVIRREDPSGDLYDWILPEQLRQRWDHITVPTDEGKLQNIVSAFMEWEDAPRYDKVAFNPEVKGHYGNCFNMWQGWMVEPEEGDDDLPLWEVHAAACGYNADYIDYFTKWLAHIVQQPAHKPGTAIGIVGPQGVGKSALVETIGMLMSTINRADNKSVIRGAFGDFKIDELMADYNEHICYKLLVYLDEATWGGSQKDAQTMKTLITKSDENINPKFLGKITLPCYRRLIFSSNNGFYYRPDKDDRRLLPLEYDTSQIHDKSYGFWKNFYEKRSKGKMLQNLLYHLQQVDLTDWEPQTALKKLKIVTGSAMLEESRKPYEHWLREVCESGQIIVDHLDAENPRSEGPIFVENKEIDDKELERAYLLWAKKNSIKDPWFSDSFKKDRVKVFGKRLDRMINRVKLKVREIPDCEEMLKRFHSDQRWEV